MSATHTLARRNDGISMTLPISPDYVKSWTTPRAIVELITNALDEDPHATVSWADGALSIEDRGPGIAQEAFLLGASSKSSHQIGQFGEGKKLAALVLARDPEVGEVFFETVGYTFTPSIEHRSLLDGIVPLRGANAAATLVYTLYPADRTVGTKITIQCSQKTAEDAISRVLHLTEPGYSPPQEHARVLLDGTPGRIFIGGIRVSTDTRLSASYDLPLSLAKADQNRDRTIVDGRALDQYIKEALAESADPTVIDHFVTLALSGQKIASQELYFSKVRDYSVKLAFKAAARRAFPADARLYYSDRDKNASGAEGMEENAWLMQRGVLMVETDLPPYQHHALMDLLGVERRSAARKTEARRHANKTTWVSLDSLAATQRQNLDYTVALFRAALGFGTIGKVRVYSEAEDIGCGTAGRYYGDTDVIAFHQDTLTDREKCVATLVHEAGHRKAFFEETGHSDRSAGFERALHNIGAALLNLCAVLADGTLPLELNDPEAWEDTDLPPGAQLVIPRKPTPPAKPDRRELARAQRLEEAPESRRLLADLLHPRMKELSATTGQSVAGLMKGIALKTAYWSVLDSPRRVGWRASRGVSHVNDYDKVTAIAGLFGVNPGVLWLAHMAPEAPTFNGRKAEKDSRPWSHALQKPLARAIADLQRAGGVHAAQIPLIQAMADGHTEYDAEGAWLRPILILLHAEQERLN
ncbi:hypothetical protein ACWC5I_05075 [Kitasatospora sp. NPDC001574]